jgi:hypothetical protein
MRTIREEPAAQRAVDAGAAADEAWSAVTWVLARDPTVGLPLREGGKVRSFTVQGVRSMDMPTVTVLYEIEPNDIVIHNALFAEADAFQAGRA